MQPPVAASASEWILCTVPKTDRSLISFSCLSAFVVNQLPLSLFPGFTISRFVGVLAFPLSAFSLFRR